MGNRVTIINGVKYLASSLGCSVILAHCMKTVYSNAEPLQKLFWIKKLLDISQTTSNSQTAEMAMPIQHASGTLIRH